MGTMILRSHNCFRGGLRHGALPLTTPLEPSRNPTSNPSTGRRRKRSPAGIQSKIRDRDRGDQSVAARVSARNLVMGQVKILKRGEKLLQTRKGCNSNKEDLDLALGSTDRLGPDPETVQKQIRVSEIKVADGIYAGSAFFASPPPSSLPVPGFLGKKNGSATSDLLRLLRLDSV